MKIMSTTLMMCRWKKVGTSFTYGMMNCMAKSQLICLLCSKEWNGSFIIKNRPCMAFLLEGITRFHYSLIDNKLHW